MQASPGGLVHAPHSATPHCDPTLRFVRCRGPHYSCEVSALAWWLIPIAATILAVGWAALRSRPEPPTEAHEGMEQLRRMQEAMNRPLPGSGSGE